MPVSRRDLNFGSGGGGPPDIVNEIAISLAEMEIHGERGPVEHGRATCMLVLGATGRVFFVRWAG